MPNTNKSQRKKDLEELEKFCEKIYNDTLGYIEWLDKIPHWHYLLEIVRERARNEKTD